MFSVALHGLPEVRHELSSDTINNRTRDVLEAAQKVGTRIAREGAPGHISRSIQGEVRGLEAEIRSSLAEALPIDRGRHAGAAFPPPNALLNWMQRHGFAGSAFVLARAIQRRGIRGRFFMRAAREAIVRDWPRLVKHFGGPWS